MDDEDEREVTQAFLDGMDPDDRARISLRNAIDHLIATHARANGWTQTETVMIAQETLADHPRAPPPLEELAALCVFEKQKKMA